MYLEVLVVPTTRTYESEPIRKRFLQMSFSYRSPGETIPIIQVGPKFNDRCPYKRHTEERAREDKAV